MVSIVCEAPCPLIAWEVVSKFSDGYAMFVNAVLNKDVQFQTIKCKSPVRNSIRCLTIMPSASASRTACPHCCLGCFLMTASFRILLAKLYLHAAGLIPNFPLVMFE